MCVPIHVQGCLCGSARNLQLTGLGGMEYKYNCFQVEPNKAAKPEIHTCDAGRSFQHRDHKSNQEPWPTIGHCDLRRAPHGVTDGLAGM
jgi:hypothetical protein